MTKERNFPNRAAQVLTAGAAMTTACATARLSKQDQDFLTRLQDENPDVRYAALITADTMSPSVVPELARLLNSENPGVAKSAGEALRCHVHGAAKDFDSEKRVAVMNALLEFIGEDQPRKVRVAAIRHLSTVGDEQAVALLVPLLDDPDMREEAVYCLERIPGSACGEALLQAMQAASKDFKPRLIAALGHRKEEAAVRPLMWVMSSGDPDVSIPAMKALARIGKREDVGGVSLPDFDSLSDRNKRAFADSWVRFIEAQVDQGNLEEPEQTYMWMLENSDGEHYKCAAVVGLGRVGNAAGVQAVMKALRSDSYIVRATAERVLVSIEGDAVDRQLRELLPTLRGEEKDLIQSILNDRA